MIKIKRKTELAHKSYEEVPFFMYDGDCKGMFMQSNQLSYIEMSVKTDQSVYGKRKVRDYEVYH